ncbi:MAG: GNAT family N-acetyltransferase [Planctomycetota bacterium]|nr:GNAT family N-acetyltransferase [Planctomycetota bacterium]
MTHMPEYTMQVYFAGDPLPPEATELFGAEVDKAWANAATAAEGPGPGRPMPACVAATTDGQWLAGLFMLLELDDAPETGQPQRVASIRHLIVPSEFRGRGLAGRLLRRASSVAKESGCARIRSTAGWGCPDHLIMYDRLGYTKAPGVDRPYLVTRGLERV